MMTSFVENIPGIVNAIAELKPARILDIGGGFGKFALLAREALLSIQAEAGDLKPQDRLVIDCAEGCRYFQELPYHGPLYNHHFHGDAKALEPEYLATFDIILLIDVLEHWKKAEAVAFITRLQGLGRPRVLISTPKAVFFYKQEFYGPDCPKHMAQWVMDDFRGLDIKRDISNERSIILIL